MNYLLRLTPSDIQIRGMAHPHSLRHPLFRRRWFTDEVIITCVRWYLRFKLSYRDLAELARELGISVAPSTILRWVVGTSQSSRNVGKPTSGRSAIPGG
jgi:transposase-like protein